MPRWDWAWISSTFCHHGMYSRQKWSLDPRRDGPWVPCKYRTWWCNADFLYKPIKHLWPVCHPYTAILRVRVMAQRTNSISVEEPGLLKLSYITHGLSNSSRRAFGDCCYGSNWTAHGCSWPYPGGFVMYGNMSWKALETLSADFTDSSNVSVQYRHPAYCRPGLTWAAIL